MAVIRSAAGSSRCADHLRGDFELCGDGVLVPGGYARNATLNQLSGAQAREDDELKRPEMGRSPYDQDSSFHRCTDDDRCNHRFAPGSSGVVGAQLMCED